MHDLPRRCPPAFEEEVERLREQALERITRIPIATLIWGPSPTSQTPSADARRILRDRLRHEGHLARFSEELINFESELSIVSQQLAQAEAFDIVFSIPDSIGSVAEIHDFSRIPWLSHKIVAFVNSEWNDGYSNQSLIQLQSIVTCQIQHYKSADMPNGVVQTALGMVRRLQEVYYMLGRRC